MSLRDSNSRQISPSFLQKRRSAFSAALRHDDCPRRSSFTRALSGRFSRLWRETGGRRMPRSMRYMSRSSLVLIPCLSGHTLRATLGALRHVAALLSGLLSQIKFGPLLQNARLGSGEPGLSLWLRRGVTRSIREFKQRRLTMFLNRITIIGFLGNDAVTRTANNASFTVLSLATKSSFKDKKTGATQRVCPGVFDPEARPCGKDQPGGAGNRRDQPRGRGRLGSSSSFVEVQRLSGLPHRQESRNEFRVDPSFPSPDRATAA